MNIIKKLNLLLLLLLTIASCNKKDDPQPKPVEIVADAGPDQTVDTGESVSLDGSGSTESENETLSYKWIIKSKPASSKSTLTAPKTVNPTFVPDVAGEYEVELTVTSENGTDTDIVDITVNS